MQYCTYHQSLASNLVLYTFISQWWHTKQVLAETKKNAMQRKLKILYIFGGRCSCKILRRFGRFCQNNAELYKNRDIEKYPFFCAIYTVILHSPCHHLLTNLFVKKNTGYTVLITLPIKQFVLEVVCDLYYNIILQIVEFFLYDWWSWLSLSLQMILKL